MYHRHDFHPEVFCRNVLIYLRPEFRPRIMDGCQSVLIPGGLLFRGDADGGVAGGMWLRTASCRVCRFQWRNGLCRSGAAFIYSAIGIYEVTRPEGGMIAFDEFRRTLEETISAGGSPREILAIMREIQGKHEFEDDVSILELVMD